MRERRQADQKASTSIAKLGLETLQASTFIEGIAAKEALKHFEPAQKAVDLLTSSTLQKLTAATAKPL